MNFQRAHLFAHTTISIHHLCLQDIAARREIGKGCLRTSFRCQHPLVIKSLHAIEETATCRNTYLVGSQLYGKRLILITEIQFRVGIQRFSQRHSSFKLLTSLERMIEEYETAEQDFCMFLGRKDLGRIDDINTILTADGDGSISHQTGRTLVKLAALQAIKRIEADHRNVPFALIVLGQRNTGNDKFRNQPDVMLLIFEHHTAYRALRTIEVID